MKAEGSTIETDGGDWHILTKTTQSRMLHLLTIARITNLSTLSDMISLPAALIFRSFSSVFLASLTRTVLFCLDILGFHHGTIFFVTPFPVFDLAIPGAVSCSLASAATVHFFSSQSLHTVSAVKEISTISIRKRISIAFENAQNLPNELLALALRLGKCGTRRGANLWHAVADCV